MVTTISVVKHSKTTSHKTFVGKISIGQKQLHARFYVKRGRWVYEGSRLELK